MYISNHRMGWKPLHIAKSVMARWSDYIRKILSIHGDIEPEALETYKSAVSVLHWMKNQLWMRWLERSMYSKMENHRDVTEFHQKYGNTGELICPTDCTNGPPKYERTAMYHKPGRMPA